MSRLLKIILTSIFLFFLAALLSPPAYANNLFVEALTSPGQNLEKFVAGEQLVNRDQGTLGLIGIMLDGTSGYLLGVYDPQTGDLISQNSALQSLALATGTMYRQPISSVQYLAFMRNKIGIVKPSYAATPGTEILAPLIIIWEGIRNVSYVFFIIIFVAVGFMIMFRSKLNPQTIINIQLALPRIIIALILVTFSFAILSFLVDLAFFGNQLVAGALGNPLVDAATKAGFSFNWRPFDNSTDPSSGFLIHVLGRFGENNVLQLIIKALGAIGGLIALQDFDSIFLIIIAFSLVGSLVKIFFALLTRHVTIILSVIGAPLVFLLSAVPSQNNTATTFLKTFLSAVLTFPAVLVILNLALFFSAATDPRLNNVIPPFFLGTKPDSDVIHTMGGFIALGLLMVASKIPQVLDEVFQVKGGAIAAAGGEIGGAVRKIPIIGGLIS